LLLCHFFWGGRGGDGNCFYCTAKFFTVSSYKCFCTESQTIYAASQCDWNEVLDSIVNEHKATISIILYWYSSCIHDINHKGKMLKTCVAIVPGSCLCQGCFQCELGILSLCPNLCICRKLRILLLLMINTDYFWVVLFFLISKFCCLNKHQYLIFLINNKQTTETFRYLQGRYNDYVK